MTASVSLVADPERRVVALANDHLYRHDHLYEDSR
jgi:hypothetical protein